jgi:MFS family permease
MLNPAIPSSPALPLAIRRLLGVQGMMNTSHFMTIPLLAIYMSAQLQFGAAALAAVMSANLICAQVLPLLTGVMADRLGSHGLVTVGLALRGAGFLGFCIFDSVVGWVGSAMLAGTGVACYEGGVYAVFGKQPKALLPRIFAANNQMLNIGAAVGPIVGGLAGMLDIRWAFAISAAAFMGLACVSALTKPASTVSLQSQPILAALRAVSCHRGLWRLMLAALPWFFLFPQLYVAFPVYAEKLAGPHAASALYVVNGVVGLIFLTVLKRRLVESPPASLAMGAYLAAAVAFTSVSMLPGIMWFLMFMVVYTIIETILLPTFETLTASLAPDGSQGACFGVLNAAGALGGSAGYYVGSWLVLNRSPVETWLSFGAVGLLGFILSFVLLRSHRVLDAQTPVTAGRDGS